MKNLYFCFIFLLASFQCQAMVAYISINPEECTSCTKHMDLFFQVKGEVPVYFVLEAKHKNDSGAIVASLYLQDYPASYIWSDELYDQVSFNRLSSIRFMANNGRFLYGCPLKAFNAPEEDLFMRISASVDTIVLPQEMKGKVFQPILSMGSQLYFCNQLQMQAQVYDVFNQTIIRTIATEPEDVRLAFDLALGKDQFEFHQTELKRLRVPRTKSWRFCYTTPTSMIAVGAYEYISKIHGKDTAVSGFYGFNEFDSTGARKIFVPSDTKNNLGNYIVKNRDSFLIYPFIHSFKGDYFVQLRQYQPERKVVNTRFLGKFTVQDQVLQLTELLDYTYPAIYVNGNNSNVLFFEGFFMLPLEAAVYSLKTKEKIQIKGLEFQHSAAGLAVPEKYIADFTLAGSILNVLYHDTKNWKYHVLRYDLQKKLVVFDKIIPSGREVPVLDQLDFDYVYFPIASDRLIRQSLISL